VRNYLPEAMGKLSANNRVEELGSHAKLETLSEEKQRSRPKEF
jgi:hypothetical protein